MRTDLTPEDQIILLLARGVVPPEAQEQALATLATPVRWERVLAQARAHGVYPLLYRNLCRLGCRGVPPPIRAELERLTKINAFRSLRLATELTAALRLLANAGIPALPLKGVALAQSLYGNVTLRVCSDIDVLIPRQAVVQALAILLPAQERNGKQTPAASIGIDFLLRNHKGYTFISNRRGFPCSLDLHWHIAWSLHKNDAAMDDLWREARRQDFQGQAAWMVSPEWELLYLTVHATRHGWQRVKWLVDIHEICAGRDIEWERVWDKAQRLGWDEALRLTLSVCHTLFTTPCPAGFSFQELPSWVKVFPDVSLSPPPGQDKLLPLHLLKRPAERLRYLVRAVFIPTWTDRRLVRPPSRLGFLYYLLRPVRLACRWSWWFVRVGCRAWRG